jgi:hypothetical protein
MTGALADALHAEWTKARTVASTGWLLLAAVVLIVAVGAARTPARGGSGDHDDLLAW